MQRSIAVIEKHTGKRPRGNRSPLYNYSINTTDLLVEEGFLYDSSLMGDDVPYILDNGKGEIVELPSSWALDDWPPYVHSIDLNYMFQIMSPDRAMETFMAEFEAMRTRRRRPVDRRVASLRQRQAVALAQDREDDRIHAEHGRCVVCPTRGHRQSCPGRLQAGHLPSARRQAALLRSAADPFAAALADAAQSPATDQFWRLPWRLSPNDVPRIFGDVPAFMACRYAPILTKCGSPDVVVIGMPYDGIATFRGGATRRAPQEIRKYSLLVRLLSLRLGHQRARSREAGRLRRYRCRAGRHALKLPAPRRAHRRNPAHRRGAHDDGRRPRRHLSGG